MNLKKDNKHIFKIIDNNNIKKENKVKDNLNKRKSN